MIDVSLGRVNTGSGVNLDGNIVQANYVKFIGDFNFDPRAEGKAASYLELTYNLNPTPNDRNLEFKSKQNILRGLKSNESVR